MPSRKPTPAPEAVSEETTEAPTTETASEEAPAPKKRRGAEPFYLTKFAQELERAERRVSVLRRQAGLDKAKERFEKAKADLEAAQEKATELPEAEAVLAEAQRAFDEALARKSAPKTPESTETASE